MTDHQVVQLKAWENALRHSSALADAERMRDSVVDPRTAGAESCWAIMWNKPLYANMYVAIAERHEEALAPQMTGAWRFIGADPSRYLIRHQGKGNAATSFTLEGTLAIGIRTDRKIALHRMFALQGAANLLRKLVDDAGAQAPFRALANLPLDRLISELRVELGRGWGPITVMHMLTDLGLAVKPDLHLVRAVHRLGLLTDIKENGVPSEKDAIRISTAVAKLADQFVGGSATPADLRYLDKVLMESSRQKLLDIPANDGQSSRDAA